MGAPTKKGSRSIQGASRTAKSPAKGATSKTSAKARPKRGKGKASLKPSGGIEGSTTANIVDPRVARQTPSSPSEDAAQAAAVGTQQPTHAVRTATPGAPTVPIPRTFVSGTGEVAALTNEPHLDPSFKVSHLFSGKWEPFDGWSESRIPIFWKATRSRKRRHRTRYVDNPIPRQTLRHFWRFIAESLQKPAPLDSPCLAGYRSNARNRTAPRQFSASDVTPLQAWAYLTNDLPAENSSTANSYLAGNGTMRNGALGATSGLGTFHQTDDNGMEVHDEDGVITRPPVWGTVASSCPATLTDVPYLQFVPGTDFVCFILRNGTNQNTVNFKLFAMDPADPHWNTATGGGWLTGSAFNALEQRNTGTIDLEYTNASAEVVQVTMNTRVAIVVENIGATIQSLGSIAMQFVDPQGVLPDYTALLVPDARTIDEVGLLNTQLGNQVLLKCNASNLSNQGSLAASILPPDYFEHHDPTVLDYAAVSALPRKFIAPAKEGVVIANPVTSGSQELDSPESYWLSEDNRRPLWVIAIDGAIAPFTLDQRINMCVVQDGQLLPKLPVVADMLDFSRSQAVQSVLPVAHAYGEDGDTHSLFSSTVSAAYAVACTLFPRVEQVGDFAMHVWNAVSGLF